MIIIAFTKHMINSLQSLLSITIICYTVKKKTTKKKKTHRKKFPDVHFRHSYNDDDMDNGVLRPFQHYISHNEMLIG